MESASTVAEQEDYSKKEVDDDTFRALWYCALVRASGSGEGEAEQEDDEEGCLIAGTAGGETCVESAETCEEEVQLNPDVCIEPDAVQLVGGLPFLAHAGTSCIFREFLVRKLKWLEKEARRDNLEMDDVLDAIQLVKA